MNRFKKEIRKRGHKLESDYECMPYEPQLLDGVYVDTENVSITYAHFSMVVKITFNRDMSEIEKYF